MTKTLFALVAGLCLSASASAGQIGFSIDCMIHAPQGALLSDLGMVGMMMDGSYMQAQDFKWNDLTIHASLQGPSPVTPEVDSPDQLHLVIERNGKVDAAVTVDATPDTNIALFDPAENVYLHCDKMNM